MTRWHGKSATELIFVAVKHELVNYCYTLYFSYVTSQQQQVNE